MKKLLIIYALCLFILPAAADNGEMFLDINAKEMHRFNTGEYDFNNPEVKHGEEEEEEQYLKPSFRTMIKMIKEDLYEAEPYSGTPKKKREKTVIKQ